MASLDASPGVDRAPRWRDVLPVAAAVAAYAVPFGALAVETGLGLAGALAMSALVYAGGSQFAFLGVLTAGGTPLAAAASGLALNSRLSGFAVALGDVLRGERGLRRLAAVHLVTDETVAFTAATPSAHRRSMFWRSAAATFGPWMAGTTVGALAGAVVGDPEAFGLDVAFPAAFAALLVPLLADRVTRVAAALGATVALAATPLLPPGLPILAALGVPLVVAATGRR